MKLGHVTSCTGSSLPDWKYLSYPFLGSVRYKEYLDRCTKGIGCSIGMIFPCGRKENKIEGEAEEEKQKFLGNGMLYVCLRLVLVLPVDLCGTAMSPRDQKR
ncbi:unnamed protein product [Cuscuta campestris]|uniref:Uncharacterized protein n=1 Tax=Cuscuta campestris TaxID=132261 RepID=A0A484K0L9_9ASTE|nr:unnamed protein product [Cuscuta campestris]